MMYRVKTFSMVIAFVCSLFVSVFAVNTGTANALTYDNTNPYSTGCASKGLIVYQTKNIYKANTSTKIGTITLYGSTYCHTAWAYIKLTSAAPEDHYANAWVVRYNSAGSWHYQLSCSSSGGNGVVNKGQTSCYTGQVWNRDPYKSKATATVYTSGSSSFAETSKH